LWKSGSGTDAMIFKIFSPKKIAKIAFFTHKAKLWNNFDPNIGFWENANFFAENWRKSQKIVIITSTPDCLFFAYFFKSDVYKFFLEEEWYFSPIYS
jgi:hypothetical protein